MEVNQTTGSSNISNHGAFISLARHIETHLGRYTVSSAILALTVFAFFLPAIATVKMDPREPPLINQRIPYIGHFLKLAKNRVGYFAELYEKTKLPIITLQLGRSKLYVIFSARLMQPAMRAKNMDVLSFTGKYIPRLFAIKQETYESLMGVDGVHEPIQPAIEQSFITSLAGEHLNRMTVSALTCVAEALGKIGDDGRHVPNLYMWLQEIMSLAISDGIFGREHNPYKDSKIQDAQWDFEANMTPLILGVVPNLIARKAERARRIVWPALKRYYGAQHDQGESVSELIRARTRLLRRWDMPLDELAKNELSIMLASQTNTIPTLFWCVTNVWLRPTLVDELRTEVWAALDISEGGKRAVGARPPEGAKAVTVNVADITTKFPLLAACYREAIRLSIQIITFRRIHEDTILTDPKTGESFLVKKNCNIMMPARAAHRHKETWGEDADEYNPYRWLPSGNKEVDAARKASFVAFGGGKHLCPGRNFAFTENLSFMAALVTGFEVEGLDVNRLKMQISKIGEATKPAPGFEGGPLVIKRRKGWENIDWKFGFETLEGWTVSGDSW